jgi:hypothetical protein
MEIAMPFMFFAMYSHWWKSALKPEKQTTSVIVLMPEEDAPELAVTTSAPDAYEG